LAVGTVVRLVHGVRKPYKGLEGTVEAVDESEVRVRITSAGEQKGKVKKVAPSALEVARPLGSSPFAVAAGEVDFGAGLLEASRGISQEEAELAAALFAD